MCKDTDRAARSVGITYRQAAEQMAQAASLHTDPFVCPSAERRARIERLLSDDAATPVTRDSRAAKLKWQP